jgi:hypothetical protein
MIVTQPRRSPLREELSCDQSSTADRGTRTVGSGCFRHMSNHSAREWLPGHFSDPDILQVGNIGLSVTEQKLTPQQYDGYVTGKFSKMFGRFPISNYGIQATNSTVLQLLVASYYIKGPTNVDRKGLLTAFNYYTTVHRAAQWGVTGAWQPGASTQLRDDRTKLQQAHLQPYDTAQDIPGAVMLRPSQLQCSRRVAVSTAAGRRDQGVIRANLRRNARGSTCASCSTWRSFMPPQDVDQPRVPMPAHPRQLPLIVGNGGSECSVRLRA